MYEGNSVQKIASFSGTGTVVLDKDMNCFVPIICTSEFGLSLAEHLKYSSRAVNLCGGPWGRLRYE